MRSKKSLIGIQGIQAIKGPFLYGQLAKRSLVQARCCGKIAELPDDIRGAIERGDEVTLYPEDIKPVGYKDK